MTQEKKQRKVRVVVVDDSKVMNAQIRKIIESAPGMEVIGQAFDGVEALELLEKIEPDVITLDVEMPRMNGLTTLKHIMVKYSIPTVMISALTKEGAKTTYDAFRFGAADVIAKPSRRHDASLDGQAADIAAKVERAAQIRVETPKYISLPAPTGTEKPQAKGPADTNTRFIAVGAGTGGYYSLLRVIPRLTPEFRDVLMCVILTAQRYTEPFVDYLAAHSSVPVRIAEPGIGFEKGVCYVASGDQGVVLAQGAGNILYAAIGAADEKEEAQGPIDALFISVADLVGDRGVGVVLSGPGQDGAQGTAAIRKAGGIGVIQEITNCMNPSMPLAVLRKGSVEKMVPDYAVAEFILSLDETEPRRGQVAPSDTREW
jgi:two-component system chemotaxis response regulator CheB